MSFMGRSFQKSEWRLKLWTFSFFKVLVLFSIRFFFCCGLISVSKNAASTLSIHAYRKSAENVAIQITGRNMLRLGGQDLGGGRWGWPRGGKNVLTEEPGRVKSVQRKEVCVKRGTFTPADLPGASRERVRGCVWTRLCAMHTPSGPHSIPLQVSLFFPTKTVIASSPPHAEGGKALSQLCIPGLGQGAGGLLPSSPRTQHCILFPGPLAGGRMVQWLGVWP